MELMINLYECKNINININTEMEKEAEKLGFLWYIARVTIAGGIDYNISGIIVLVKYEKLEPIYFFKHQVGNKTKLYQFKPIKPVEPYRDLRYTVLESGLHELKIEVRGSDILNIRFEFKWSDRITFNPTELFIKRATHHVIGYF